MGWVTPKILLGYATATTTSQWRPQTKMGGVTNTDLRAFGN